MKKLLLATLLAVVTLSACGAEPTGHVTIGVWKGNDAEELALDTMIADFEATNDITIEKRVYSDYGTQLTTELIGGTAPDAFYVEASLAPSLIKDGALIEMTSEIDDIDDFEESSLAGFTQDGSVYAIPKDFSTLGLFYNEDLLTSAGYEVSDIPTNIEEFPAFLEEVQGSLETGQTAMSCNFNIDRNYFWLEAGGNSMFNDAGELYLSNPEILENAQIIDDLMGTDGCKTASALGFGWNGDAFASGSVAFMIEGPWVLGMLDNDYSEINYGVLETPMYKDEKATALYTVGWGVNASSSNTEAAIEFVNYATGIEGMDTWTRGAGVLPSRNSLLESQNIDSDPIKSVFANQLPTSKVWQLGMYTTRISDAYNNIFPEIEAGKKDFEEGFTAIDDEVNKDIKDFGNE